MNEFTNRREWGPKANYPNVLAYPKQKDDLILIAGPCSIESIEQIETVVKALVPLKPTFMRGGVYRAGTFPGKNFGLQRELLFDWAREARRNGLETIVEVLDIRELDIIDRAADAFQVGARHMQDYALLKELSKSNKTVTLKRHPGSTLDEFLGACEYLAGGNCKPILIERGSSSLMRHVRWELSVSLIAAVKEMCNVPILVDSSHGSGRRDLVGPLCYAGLAAGADGMLVEVHPEPCKSLSDSDQAFPLDRLGELVTKAKNVRRALDSKGIKVLC